MTHTTARRAFGALLGISLALAAVPGVAADQVFTGYARDLESRRLLYVESHFVRAAGTVGEQRVVLYRCAPAGASDDARAAAAAPAFARKELDYSAAREEPRFTLLDARTGYSEGLRRTAQGLEVFQRENSGAALRRAPVPADVAIVSDAGFDEFVRRHWADLEAGRTVRFPFLVPSRLDFLTFKVKKHHEEKIEGAAASVIRLNLSGVLGWFLPYIEVSYRKSDRVLMRYRGLTNVRDTAGANIVAQIDFPSRERLTVPAVDLAAQRSVPLVSRCPP
jgi:hypothetical protein